LLTSARGVGDRLLQRKLAAGRDCLVEGGAAGDGCDESVVAHTPEMGQLGPSLFLEAFDDAPQETGTSTVSACRRDGG
jgi:hypothetical protein